MWRDQPAGDGDGAITPLIARPDYDEVAMALAPNGRWLAYASNESGQWEVYVRPYPEVDAGRWQVSDGGGTEPVWAHSGRELFFIDGAGNLVAASVSGAEGFRVEERRALFRVDGFIRDDTHAQYDVSPDDRRFLFQQQITSEGGVEATTAILVQDWLSGIDRGKGGGKPGG